MALWSHCAPAEAKLKLKVLVRSVVALVPACALLLGACGDGQQDPNFGSKVESGFASKVDPNLVGLLAEGDTTSATSSLQNVTFGKSSECEPSVTPSGIPPKGSTLEKITITFCVTVSVPETGSTFVYDKTKWAAYLGADKNNFYAGEGKITVDADNERLGGSETTRNGKLTLSIVMPGNKLPDTFYGAFDTSTGRERLAVTPFYSQGGGPPTDANSREISGLQAFLQNDVGAIAAPPSVRKITTSDGEFVVEVAPPASLASVDPRDPSLKGTSSLSGYLVMYWNHDECTAARSWDFRANGVSDRNIPKGTFRRSEVTFTCQYPGEPKAEGTSPCAFGCSVSKDAALLNKSAEEILVPASFPDAAGKTVKNGCYTVARIDASRSSFSVSGVENGSLYGVSVFALDSAGRVGLGRSPCGAVTPRDIPLASKEKGADISRSDCFVVTAASGDTGSAAVHYWRVARDAYIEKTPWGRAAVAWYYDNGPRVARWLDAHPRFKAPLNQVFEWTGRAVVVSGRWLRRAAVFVRRVSNEAFGLPEARAQDSTAGVFGNDPVDGSPTGFPPSGALYVLVGVLTPTDDTALYKAYYPKKRPLAVTLGQTFRLLDAAGELGVGGEVSYVGTTGKVPEKTAKEGVAIPEDVRGRKISFYSLGLAVALDYRLRLSATPWLAPRVALVGGVQRMREEVANGEDPNTSGGQEGNVGNLGAEGWGGVVGARGSLEFSALKLWGADAGNVRYSYGLEDLALSLYVSYTKDFAKKMLRVSGVQGGAGFVFLFL
jgi:hypothetical protein